MADLIGSTIRVISYRPTLEDPTGTDTAIVSSTRAEFIRLEDEGNSVARTINFTADQYIYRIGNTSYSVFGSGEFNGAVYENISVGGPDFYSASISAAGNTFGLPPDRVTVVNGQLRINVASLSFSDGDGYTLNLGFTYRGTGAADTLLGARFADQLLGNGGNDTLRGGTGADILSGGAGSDMLAGGDGADTLNGGDDGDTMQGGAGNDIFQFLLPGTSDRIVAGDGVVAFERPGQALGDRFDLSQIDGNISMTGHQNLIFGTATGVGRVWAVSVGATTLIRANVDGDPAVEFEVAITDGAVSHSAYTAADFIL